MIAGDEDHLFTIEEQEATARPYGTSAVIFTGFGHDLMLEPGWEEPATYVADWLDEVSVSRPRH
ncbi:MAG: hypothetical protein ACE5MI_10700 [Acidimicrobiia bacterium]